ncbi:MAG TPA: formate dehydrogenase subunit gamma [Acidimicrobiales bacterium]|jgi:formate dehydrogenase subunit gamma|nr:formate dehydrogenase subunit gamma [Acidimicrobiales bacterium]
MTVTTTPTHGEAVPTAAPHEIVRYSWLERLLHWTVAITFIALMLSGMALAYPRAAWLSRLFGGGQTMRAAHPWIGLVFTAATVLMAGRWLRGMLFDATDRAWFKRIGQYAREGHAGVDTGRWNGGQKAYFWFAVVLTLGLLLTGIPLWFPWMAGVGVRQLARLLHHVGYLLMVGGFIIHVLLSAVLFPGTMAGMTSGRVSRAWAAYHHPRWFRQQEDADQ